MGYAGPGALDLLGFHIVYPNQSHALFLLHEIFVNGVYCFSPARRQPTIVDCGANIGMAVIFFKALVPDARVTAIEPDAATFDLLRRNVDRNHLTDVTLVHAAVTDRAGRSSCTAVRELEEDLQPASIRLGAGPATERFAVSRSRRCSTARSIS